MPSVETIIRSQQFVPFLTEATLFCRLLESDFQMDVVDFLKTTQTHLLKLYLHAQVLEYVDLNHNNVFADMMNDFEFTDVVNKISTRLNDNRLYMVMSSPTNLYDTEPGCGDLLDDISDIYKDIKNALLLFEVQRPAEIETAIFSMKSDFVSHWGFHCVNAIYALHNFRSRLA